MFDFLKPKHSELSNPIEANAPSESEKQYHGLLMGHVTYILDKYPKSRDDKKEFFKKFSDHYGWFTPNTAETLARNWRFIQRKREDLRWEEFYARQKKAKATARLYTKT